MTMLTQLGAASAHLQGARIETGAVRTLDTLAELISGADERITTELFKVTEPGVVGALRERARTIPVRLHGDSQYVNDPAEYAVSARDGIAITSHGESPIKLHTKLLVADGERGYLGTAAPVEKLYEQDAVDFGAVVGAREARLLEAATEAAISGDSARIAASAQALAPHGIFIGDTTHGVQLLRDRVESLIDGATSSIYVGSKILGDERSMQRLAAKQADGVRVLVETSGKAAGPEIQQARDLGLDVTAMPKSFRRLHGNIVVADGREAYMGTAMLSLRGMGRPEFGRTARESGWVTRDQAAIDDAFEKIQTLDGSRLREFRELM